MVQPGGIGIKQGPNVSGLLHVIALYRFAGTHQPQREINPGTGLPVQRAKPTACHRDHVLQRREIILGMGIGDAVADIGVTGAKHMRHAEIVTHNPGIIAVRGRRGRSGRRQRLPNGKPDCSDDQEHQHARAQAPQQFPHPPPHF